MQIDWFTFAAQIVNFLILVWLLRRFLYDRILEAMNRREERIADRLKEARRKEEAADRRARELEDERGKLEERREEMLAEAREEADRTREELVGEVREEVREMEDRWKESLEQARASFRDEFTREVAREVIALARQVLADLADEELEVRVVDRFIDRLRELETDRARALEEALSGGEDPVVRSAFELDATQREALERELGRLVDREPTPRYRVDGEVGFGIELRVAGWRVGWSLDDYLEGVEEELVEELSEEGR